jgi:hypothetical protein
MTRQMTPFTPRATAKSTPVICTARTARQGWLGGLWVRRGGAGLRAAAQHAAHARAVLGSRAAQHWPAAARPTVGLPGGMQPASSMHAGRGRRATHRHGGRRGSLLGLGRRNRRGDGHPEWWALVAGGRAGRRLPGRALSTLECTGQALRAWLTQPRRRARAVTASHELHPSSTRACAKARTMNLHRPPRVGARAHSRSWSLAARPRGWVVPPLPDAPNTTGCCVPLRVPAVPASPASPAAQITAP